ncbi:MAG TPA: hypothetical protein VN739_09840 [Nitrososphaerales archaeon]|nr:hypothetical protein [Nitrososphaerales archaeon]
MGNICEGSRFYIGIGSFLPYLMLVSGIILAYNMKLYADASTIEEQRNMGSPD